VPLSRRGAYSDAAALAGVEHDSVVDELVLLNHAVDIATGDDGAHGELAGGVEGPPLLRVESLDVDTPVQSDRSRG
jgi:hypothetical protein